MSTPCSLRWSRKLPPARTTRNRNIPCRGTALALLALALAPLVTPAGIAAQAETSAGESPTVEQRPVCFPGGPLAECKRFWLVELQGFLPLLQTTRVVEFDQSPSILSEAFGRAVELNVGHMVNIDSTWAFGGTVALANLGVGGYWGLRGRVRRWVSPDVALEVSGGILGGGEHHFANQGLTADVRLNHRDQGAIIVRWDGVSLPEYARYGEMDPGGFQQAVSVGVAAGGYRAMLLTGLTVAVLMTILRGLALG